ncbi:MAG TPA: TnsD family Tn7-like transposition protein [Paraburkholderia sp.]
MEATNIAFNLPILRPDETLYSWNGFVHLWNFDINAVDTSLRLYGSPYAALQHDFPSHLSLLTEFTETQFGSAIDLALKHTLLGYYLPVIPLDLSRRILSSVQSTSARHMKLKLGIPSSRLGANHPLKACTKCIREDIKRYDSAYWHVSHQYPSVLTCPIHRCPLRTLQIKATPVRHRKWFIPGFEPENVWVDLPTLGPAQIERLRKLADLSVCLARVPPGALEHDTLATTYRIALRELGILTHGGNLRLIDLRRWVLDYYAGFEPVSGLNVLTAATHTWPALLALSQKTRPIGHPCKHLLLICALFESWTQFEQSYKAAKERLVDASRQGAPEVALPYAN